MFVNCVRTVGVAVLCGLAWVFASLSAAQEGLTRFETKAPVNDFSLPMFGADGYKTWDLSGKQGRYVNAQRIEIDGMRLRLFSGDALAKEEVVIDSPQATVDPQAGTAGGPSFLSVNGPGYSVTGRNWFWNDKAKNLAIKKDVQVTFASGGEGSLPIMITSDQLAIETQADSYYFKFTGNVKVLNGSAQMETPELQAWSSRTQSERAQPGALRSMRRILADKGVQVLQEGRTVTAERAEMPEASLGREIVLTGSPKMHDISSDAVLTGGMVRLFRDEHAVIVTPEPSADKGGRVHASLPPSQAGANGRMEISAERLELHTQSDGARDLTFFNKVVVTDPDLIVNCDTLTAHLPPGRTGLTLPGESLGKVEWISAKGNVMVEQQSRRAYAGEARIYPDKSEAVLTEKPLMADSVSGSIMEGQKIILMKERGKVLVFGTPTQLARVMLAPMQGSGSSSPTYIFSESLQLTRGKTMSVVTFLDKVKVESVAMQMQCGAMDVFVEPSGKDGAIGSDNPTLGSIVRIEARDQVNYQQDDMRAVAARVEVFPRAMVRENLTSAAQAQRFVSLFGDPSGKRGPVRPQVYLPAFDATIDSKPGSAKPAKPAAETLITSDEQELFTDAGGSRFYFRGNVDMQGDGFTLTCDEIEVISSQAPEASGTSAVAASADHLGKPERVIAHGNVVMRQGTRTATAGTAEVSLRTGRCILADNPVVIDTQDNSRVDGYRITLLRGQNRVFVEGAPPSDTPSSQAKPARRPTILLPSFGDMGFDRTSKSSDKGN